MSADAIGFVALLLVAGASGVWFRGMRRVALPSNRMGFVVFWALGFALGIVAVWGATGWAGWAAGLLAAIAGGFFCFLVGISAQKVGGDVIRVGDTIPWFRAIDDSGEIFQLSMPLAHPLLIKFFRGHW